MREENRVLNYDNHIFQYVTPLLLKPHSLRKRFKPASTDHLEELARETIGGKIW